MRNISLFLRSVAKSFLVTVLLTLALSAATKAQDAAAGAAIFKSRCTACHKLDAKSVGPALAGVNDRHKKEWLHKWIKNSQAMIFDEKDPEAIAIYDQFKPITMTPFPDLSDGDIDNILAYIAAPPATGKKGPVVTEAKEEISDLMIGGLVLVIIVAFIVIMLLNRVTGTLERLVMKNNGVEIPEEVTVDRGAKFKKLFKNKKFVFFTGIIIIIILVSIGTVGMWNTGVHTGYQPTQPIKFSHQLHAGINKIDCRYCHSGAYKSKNASIPSLNVCMNCHNYVTAADNYGGQVSPEIAKIYTALDYNPDTREYGPNKKPIEWVRVHNLPDLAYFNHSQHVVVGGVRCQKCHGPVQTMDELYQYSPLTMKWCINCHRETEVNSKGNAYYDRMIAAHEKIKKGEKMTAAVFGGTECGKCHY
ncbi:c-type cytochrome [Hufsiella ginkgonis]|uniref:C-type cytochrome n=1 Tax=Hufsiella ginkgonis TaxID=2695274 RepID=A0A7K1Y2X2_9SPHI|nr:c-type cytochrome [Hufsiella ginkgonis]MXV17634.1 c-type cytochrome [Hufsiella ginkgonis]